MAEVTAPVRVLQSGKVYRQMFDAEVQLMKSFSATKSKQHLSSDQGLHLPQLPGAKSDPSKTDTTYGASSLSACNILSDRQISWTAGMPNDSVLENPVHYRQLSTAAAKRVIEKQMDPEAEEVRVLPTILPTTKKNSNIIDKLSERRKARHGKSLDEMHQDLSMVSNRIEPRITSIGENVQRQLKEDDQAIEEIFRTITTDDKLVNFSYEQLEKLWVEIESHSETRREWIENATVWFNQVEDERLEAISGILRNYTVKLEKIASLPDADVHRLIENEAMMINQSVLANRRAYAKLQTNLVEEDIEREVSQHRTWEERVKDWRKINAELAVQQFTDFMKSPDIVDPPQVKEVSETFLSQQKTLSEARQDILDQLKELKPPTSTKQAVYKWNTALAKAHEDIDKLHVKMVQSLHQKYEAICQICLSEIEKYKQNLLMSQVCDEDDMRRIVNNHFLPQVGNQLKEYEKGLEEMDEHLEELALLTEKQLKSLFKFVQGAAHLWDVHEIGLAKQDRKLQDDMEHSRQFHDIDNQEREMKLDVTLDRLRQESTEEALAVYLEQCLAMLNNIKDGYEDFHIEQLKKVGQYPSMIEAELVRYDDSVCKYFRVERSVPLGRESTLDFSQRRRKGRSIRRMSNKKSPISGRGRISSPAMEDQNKPSRHSQKLMKRKSGQHIDAETVKQRWKAKTKRRSKRMMEEEADSESEHPVREVISTEKGTNFFAIGSVFDEDEKEEEKKDTINEEETSPPPPEKTSFLVSMPDYTKHVYIPPPFLKDLKAQIRLSFLNHLEQWKEHTTEHAEALAKDKGEELASELDLRLHLHAPRAKRIEMDVRNVRAAELVLHRERINRHCRGITASLESIKLDFVQMTQVHDDEAAEFRSRVEKMEEVYSNATKCSKLKELSNELQTDLADYVRNIKISLRTFRHSLDGTLGKLRESNAQCVRSFKLFCEGGNFSPDETIPLRKKLEKMSQRVDYAEGLVMHDLEGMESRRIELATEHVTKFEDKFRNHFVDLSFIETMQRWATNAQVRIKTEVAHSNSMAAAVSSHLDILRRRIDACERPNIDKENVTPELLHAYMYQIMEALRERATYLHCFVPDVNITTQDVVESSGDISDTCPRRKVSSGGTRPLSSRRHPAREESGRQHSARQNMDTQGSMGRGRAPADDAAIGLIKTILRAQKEKNASDFDEMKSTTTAGTTRAPVSTANSLTGVASRQLQSLQPLSRNVQRQTAMRGNINIPEPDSQKKTIQQDGITITYKRRETKFEPKYMIFGAKPVEGSHFMCKVYQVLHESLDGMLSSAEIYYKQKGSRAITRPKMIQDSFDQCAEAVCDKLAKYDLQASEFHNNSLQNFRKLLHDLEYELCHVPSLLINDLLKNEIDAMRNNQYEIEKQFQFFKKELENEKKVHKEELRPTLGHPDQKLILEKLSELENTRTERHTNGINEHAGALEKNVLECASRFADQLTSISSRLLQDFDSLLIVDDIIVGRVPPRKELTSVLMRRRADGHEMSAVADPSFGLKPIVERGPGNWPLCDFTSLRTLQDAKAAVATETISTTHTTLPHTKIIAERDLALKKYVVAQQGALERIEAKKLLRMEGEERWKKNWEDWLLHVSSLYHAID